MTNTINGTDLIQVVKEDYGFGLTGYQEVKDYLQEATRPTDFGNYTQVPVQAKEDRGLITFKQFFEDSQTDFDVLSLEDLEEVTEGKVWEEQSSDNTYNYSGYMENNLIFLIFENDTDDEVLVFYSVHVGLDARAGYTEYFGVRYDSDYDQTDHLMEQFSVAEATYLTLGGSEEFLTIDVTACSDLARFYDHQTDKDAELGIDTTDLEDMKETIENELKELEVPFKAGSVKVAY